MNAAQQCQRAADQVWSHLWSRLCRRKPGRGVRQKGVEIQRKKGKEGKKEVKDELKREWA